MGLDMYLHAREFVAGGYEHVRKAAADGHEDTVRQLTPLLENEKLKSFEFTYRSSW